MKLLSCFAVLSVFLFAVRGTAQEKNNEPLLAMMNSIRWLDGVTAYEVETTSHVNSKSVSLLNRDDGTFSEGIEKIHEWKSSNGQVFITVADGKTILGSSNGKDEAREVSFLWTKHGNSSEAHSVLWRLDGTSHSSPLICGENNLPCSRVMRGFEWGQTLFFCMISFNSESMVSDLNAMLVQFAENNEWIRTTEKKDGKKQSVYRFKISPTPDITFGYVITVGDEGIEKGKVVDFRRHEMRKKEKDNPFTSDDQCIPHSILSSSITWKEISGPKGKDKLVAPIQVVHLLEANPLSMKKRTWTFNWKLREPDPKEMTLENAYKVGREYAREIDRILGR